MLLHHITLVNVVVCCSISEKNLVTKNSVFAAAAAVWAEREGKRKKSRIMKIAGKSYVVFVSLSVSLSVGKTSTKCKNVLNFCERLLYNFPL